MRYPNRVQVVDYLQQYCARQGIATFDDQEVTRLERLDGTWTATTRTRQWRTRNVVVATGAARQPRRPTWPGMDSYRSQLLHSSEYRNGDLGWGRRVLVVGFGNSACEQAIDLVECGAKPHLSVRSPVNVVPRDVLGLVPALQLGIAMSHVPTAVADALAWPLVRLSAGDICEGRSFARETSPEPTLFICPAPTRSFAPKGSEPTPTSRATVLPLSRLRTPLGHAS